MPAEAGRNLRNDRQWCSLARASCPRFISSHTVCVVVACVAENAVVGLFSRSELKPEAELRKIDEAMAKHQARGWPVLKLSPFPCSLFAD